MNPAIERTLRIHTAQTPDAAAIAVLCTQLGYPARTERVEKRLAAICGDSSHGVFLAEANRQVVGWAHVVVVRSITADPHAELMGLVVDSATRGGGVGSALLREAETWARAKNLPSLSVRSNIIRDRAHRFYQQRGYELIKTQSTFVKTLG